MVVDSPENSVFLACDNQNVYQYSLEAQSLQPEQNQAKSKQTRTFTHKKRVTALCLSVCGSYLVSGDLQGLIYVWSTAPESQKWKN
mmetsp:Transcript_7045/g.11859  ORF Transcript_7045/g.11859 Transcript_7045/m.11859 type:complete len:86 (+) Transcript_7045:883-1140(+)